MNHEYKQTIYVLWIASIACQDAQGNQAERGIRVMASDITEALSKVKEEAEKLAVEREWYQWMIYDIGIVPDNCFN